MPQLVPFYFVSQVVFVFSVLLILIYVFSRYILPGSVALYNARILLSK